MRLYGYRAAGGCCRGIDDPGGGGAELPIDLTTDVTGVLPKINGGAEFPISLTTEVSGVLPASNGGAGGLSNTAIPFMSGGVLSQNLTGLTWDNTNQFLGIGAATRAFPTPFPAAHIHIERPFATFRVDSTSTSSSAIIAVRALNSGANAVISTSRANALNNAYYELRNFGTAQWYSGHFSSPAALNEAWSIKTASGGLGGNPQWTLTKAGRVGIGTGSGGPAATLDVRGNGILSGTPTGGAKGLGSINSSATYINGVLGAPDEASRETSDTDTSTTATDFCIAYTTLTVTRTVTLSDVTKALGSATKRHYIRVKDESGSATGSVKIVITPESGTIDGVASIDLTTTYGSGTVYTNGTNWFTQG